MRVEAGYNQLCEAPRSLAMADAEAVAVWRLKHELACSPRRGLDRFHQAWAGAEAVEDLVNIGDVDEAPPRLGWLVDHIAG